MARRPVLFAVLAALAAPAYAAATPANREIEAASRAMADALVPIGLAKGLVAACAARDPAGAAARDGHHAAWRGRNGVAGFEAALAAVEPKAPGLAARRAELDRAAVVEAAGVVERDPATCGRLADVLAAPSFAIAPVTTRARRLLLAIAARR
ncbi:MAG: hypothetical protein IT561_05300 [Alphaproteobacteria bacterium]|nr:hypothetical protein [Alphaproteobacteria bacterium]